MSDDEKSGYFKMSKAFDEFNDGFDAKEKAAAGLKLFGKGLFNVAKYAVTEALPKYAELVEKEKNKRR